MTESAQSGAVAASLVPRRAQRRRVVVALVAVAAIVATLVVLGALGVLPGTGPDLGPGVSVDQVRRDFLAAQEAESQALASGDAGKAGDRVVGNAGQDLESRISSYNLYGYRQTTTYKDVSLEFLQAPDPHDPETTVEVHETGYATVQTTDANGNSASAPQDLKFDVKAWLRQLNGHWAVTDEVTTSEPGSPPPYGLLAAAVVVVLLAIGCVVVLLRRRTSRRPASVLTAPMVTAVMWDDADTVPPAPRPWTGAREPGIVLGIQTIGGLKIYADGVDIAADLLDSPVTTFIWLRLLVQAIQDPAKRVSRDELVDEVFPRVTRKAQLKRLTQRLYALRHAHPVLADRVRGEGTFLSFDLTGCSVDAVELIAAARSAGALTPRQVADLLALTAGDFLPLWESLDDKVTGARGGSREAVEELRDQLAVARVDLLGALGDAYMAAAQVERAAVVLNEALRLRPDREDIAQRLAVAYRAAGRQAAATRVTEEYAAET